MSKQVILTGIRANNDLHIGNYLGALLPMVDMAKQRSGEYQVNLMMADLHSFTTPVDHAKLQEQIRQNLKVFVAAGLPLDNDDIHVFRQSYVSAHSELAIILDSFTGMGEMSRMTQYKDKSRRLHKENSAIFNTELRGDHGTAVLEQMKADVVDRIVGRVSVGLFNYPVLMAADILLYGAEYVPVGDDQTQHLEFARDIAERMNKKFGDLFTVPRPVKEQHKFFGKDQGLRVRDLQNPSSKMSKSEESGKGVIFLTDSPGQARKKIMSAETDSLGEVRHDYAKQPGVSNLLDMLKLFGGDPGKFTGQKQYGPLKEAVAGAVADFLGDFQERLEQVDEQAVQVKLEASEKEMNRQADATLLKVQKAVGLR